MKTPFSSLILALLVAAILPLAYASESASLLLQKGIYAEEIERNLDSAIKIYEQIGAEAAANRAVAAQAQYRLALCYQKKGDKAQAIKLLNELVQQPPGDPSMSQKARATLTELGATPPEAVSVRRIPLSGNPGWIVAVSPDGRLVGFLPWDSNELFVQDLTTGKTQLIASDAAMRGHSPPARFSPDGQWIAYDYQEAGIHIAKTDGTEVRKLLDATKSDGKGLWNEVVGWSADGTQVITAQWDGTRNCRVAVALDAKTGVAKEMAAALNRGTSQWKISDDCRYTTCLRSGYPTSMTLLDFQSGREELIVERNASHVIGWAFGDTQIVHSKNGARGLEIWTVDVRDGKTVGEPRLVSSESVNSFSRGARFVEPLGVARDGRIFYTVDRGKPTVSEFWVMEGFISSQPTTPASEMTRTEIPPDELIVGPNRSLLDRKFGLSATVPADWKISLAERTSNGGSVINFDISGAKSAMVSVGYRSTSPWHEGPRQYSQWAHVFGPKKPAPNEVDAWLRETAERLVKGALQQSKNLQRDPAGIVPRLVGGHKAVAWSYTTVSNEGPRTLLYVLIYSEKAHAQISLRTPNANLAAIRPDYDRFVESFRLP